MKVAIASSGLGHINRGIETWALDTALALRQHGIETTLFAAAPIPSQQDLTVEILPTHKRNDPVVQYLTRCAPRWTWRWHLKSSYEIEQLSFWRHLKKHLQNAQFDVLHVQDPLLAQRAQRAFEKRQISCRCILAHGTEESAEYLAQFTYLQHLAPWHMDQVLQKYQAQSQSKTFPDWVMLPNFVDVQQFRPFASQAESAALRARYHLPPDACIWGTAAAIKKHHKRIDWLLQEFADAAAQRPDLHLVIAGSKQTDTNALIEHANILCPNRVSFMVDVPHEQMPDLLRSLDAFVLTSLFEMMPIALLEAISTGLPAYTHDHPVLSWMTGAGGIQLQMSTPHTLRDAMLHTKQAELRQLGQLAREHAINTFSGQAVIPAYISYYQRICKEGP